LGLNYCKYQLSISIVMNVSVPQRNTDEYSGAVIR